MATVVGSLLVQLGMDSAEFDRGISRAERNMNSASRTFQNGSRQINAANGQTKAGMQQLSFQLNDIATQWASGTRPMQIFAQQSGQVVQAIGLMAGGTGKFARFIGGPWGIALTAGIVALTPFIGKLFQTASAADTARDALGRLVDAQKQARQALDDPAQAEMALNKQREKALVLETVLDKLRKRGQAQVAAGQSGAASQTLQMFRTRKQELLAVQQGIAIGASAIKSAQASATSKATPTPRASGGGSGGGAGGSAAASGPSAAEIATQFSAERASVMMEYNSIMAGMARSAAEEAEYQLRNVELQNIRAQAAIKANKDYSEAQKQELLGAQEEIVEQQRLRVERDKARRIEEETEAAARATYEAKRDGLQTQMGLAGTDAERLRIALELFDLDQQERRNALERIIASDTRTEAEKALAQQALAALDAGEAAARANVARQNETQAQAYMRSIYKTPEQINEAIDAIKIRGLENLNDQLVDAIINFRSLGDVAQSVIRSILAEMLKLAIQKSIIGPLAGMLGLATGAIGGGIGGGLGGLNSAAQGILGVGSLSTGGIPIVPIPGFAGGTRFAPGGLSLVGEEGPELVNLRRGSQVIANDDLAGAMGRSEIHKPTFVFPGVTDAKMAREAAGQAARRYKRELNPMRAA